MECSQDLKLHCIRILFLIFFPDPLLLSRSRSVSHIVDQSFTPIKHDSTKIATIFARYIVKSDLFQATQHVVSRYKSPKYKRSIISSPSLYKCRSRGLKWETK